MARGTYTPELEAHHDHLDAEKGQGHLKYLNGYVKPGDLSQGYCVEGQHNWKQPGVDVDDYEGDFQ